MDAATVEAWSDDEEQGAFPSPRLDRVPASPPGSTAGPEARARAASGSRRKPPPRPPRKPKQAPKAVPKIATNPVRVTCPELPPPSPSKARRVPRLSSSSDTHTGNEPSPARARFARTLSGGALRKSDAPLRKGSATPPRPHRVPISPRSMSSVVEARGRRSPFASPPASPRSPEATSPRSPVLSPRCVLGTPRALDVSTITVEVDGKEHAVGVDQATRTAQLREQVILQLASTEQERSKYAEYFLYRQLGAFSSRLVLLRPRDNVVWYSGSSPWPDRLVFKPKPERLVRGSAGTIRALLRRHLEVSRNLQSDNDGQTMEELEEIRESLAESITSLERTVLLQGYVYVQFGGKGSSSSSRRYLVILQDHVRVYRRKGDRKVQGYAEFGDGKAIAITMPANDTHKFTVAFQSGENSALLGEYYAVFHIETDSASWAWEWVETFMHLGNCTFRMIEAGNIRAKKKDKKSARRMERSKSIGEGFGELKHRAQTLRIKDEKVKGDSVVLSRAPPTYEDLRCKSVNVATEAYPFSEVFRMPRIPNEDPTKVQYKLSAGTLEDILAVLVFHSTDANIHLRETFALLLGIEKYCTPEELGKAIANVWALFKARGFQCAGKDRLMERLLNFGVHFCSSPPLIGGSMDEEYRAALTDAIVEIAGPEMSMEAKKRLSARSNPLPSLHFLNSDLGMLDPALSSGKRSWFDYDTNIIVEQLTVWEASIMRQIPMAELIGTRWSKSPHLTPILNELSHRFNHVADSVATGIVTTNGIKERQKLFKKFVRVCKRLVAIRNYSSACQIWTGITHFALSRLTHLKEMSAPPDKTGIELASISALFQPSNNYSEYREQLFTAPSLPVIAVLLRDLTFLEENPVFLPSDEGAPTVINFDRCRLISKSILGSNLHCASQTHFRFPLDSHFESLVQKAEAWDGERLYAASLQIQPMKRNVTKAQLADEVGELRKQLRMMAAQMDAMSPPSMTLAASLSTAPSMTTDFEQGMSSAQDTNDETEMDPDLESMCAASCGCKQEVALLRGENASLREMVNGLLGRVLALEQSNADRASDGDGNAT